MLRNSRFQRGAHGPVQRHVAFDSAESDEELPERRAEAAMQEVLGRSFWTTVRTSAYVSELLASDPFSAYPMPDRVKRVVSFLREPCQPRVDLPLVQDGAIVLSLVGREAFTVYVRSDKGPVFMKLIEMAFGAELTTRTWETLAKCVKA